MSSLYLWFPKDFGEKYEAYKVRFSQLALEREESAGDGKKFAHRLPSGTRWENFTIAFLSDERVKITVRGIEEELGYEDMNFLDRRSGKPDSQWAFLRILSKYGGEVSWADSDARDEFKKTKERLTGRLREFFRIDYDPFLPYAETRSYKIKLTLVPPPLVAEEVAESLDTELQQLREDMTREG